MKGRIAKLRRIQDLFTAGQIVVLEAGEVAEPFWVAKPSAFERDEAMKDARAARARRALRFDRDPEERDVVESQIGHTDRDGIIDVLVGAKANEHYVKALDEIRTRKDWAERVDVVERAGTQDDRDVSDADRETAREVTTEYLTEVQRLQESYAEEYRKELCGKDADELHTAYRETWRDMTAFQAFMETRRTSEIYFALRLCEATRVDDVWVHDGCDHTERLLDKRDDVFDLPDALLTKVATALEELQMTPREAGNSAAPATSSASSEPQSAVEDSTPSGQGTTSPEPAGT